MEKRYLPEEYDDNQEKAVITKDGDYQERLALKKDEDRED